MDKDMLKGLASTLGVTMQQLDRIRWAILNQLYEKNQLEHIMLGKTLHLFKKDVQTTINELQGKYVAFVGNNVPSGYFTCGAKSGRICSELKSLHTKSHSIERSFIGY